MTMRLNLRDAAAVLNVPESKVHRWIHEADLPSVVVDDEYYFNRNDLQEWAETHRIAIAPGAFPGEAKPKEPARVTMLPEALQAGGIIYDLPGTDKDSVLRAVVERMPLPDSFYLGVVLQLLKAREAIGTTAVGEGYAIPHTRHPMVLPVGRPALTLCFLEHPIDFDAADGLPVHTLFVMVSPTIQAHQQMLARISAVLRDADCREILGRRGRPEEIIAAARRVDLAFPSVPNIGQVGPELAKSAR